jgi:hypothetical protein
MYSLITGSMVCLLHMLGMKYLMCNLRKDKYKDRTYLSIDSDMLNNWSRSNSSSHSFHLVKMSQNSNFRKCYWNSKFCILN